MRALTIQQPFAELIRSGRKRVENRSWSTRYRGPLLIHAGKSRARIDEAERYGLDPQILTFGAIVAVATLVECFKLEHRVIDGVKTAKDRVPLRLQLEYPWLATHEHVEGEWCWLVADVRPLAAPVYCNGAQGLWTPSQAIVEAAEELMGVATS